MAYRIGPDIRSYSKRGNQHLVDSATVNATWKTDEKTTKMVFYLIEIALGLRSAISAHKAFSYTDSKNPGPKTLPISNAHLIVRRGVGSSSSAFLG